MRVAEGEQFGGCRPAAARRSRQAMDHEAADGVEDVDLVAEDRPVVVSRG